MLIYNINIIIKVKKYLLLALIFALIKIFTIMLGEEKIYILWRLNNMVHYIYDLSYKYSKKIIIIIKKIYIYISIFS